LAENLADFPDLAAVAERWKDLPEHVRKTILDIVDAARQRP